MASTVEIYNNLSEIINKDYNTLLNSYTLNTNDNLNMEEMIRSFDEFKKLTQTAPLEVFKYNKSELLFDALNFALSDIEVFKKHFEKYAILLIQLGSNPFENFRNIKYYRYRANNINIVSEIYKKYINTELPKSIEEMLVALDNYD